MNGAAQFLSMWKVRAIEALPDERGVEVEFGIEGRPPVRFRTRQFAVGRRSNKTAALAKFASKAGYGAVEDVFHYLTCLPRDQVGNLFPAGPIGLVTGDNVPSPLACLWPDESDC